MPKYKVQFNGGWIGTDVSITVEALSEEDAISQVKPQAIDWFWKCNKDEAPYSYDAEVDIWVEEILT